MHARQLAHILILLVLPLLAACASSPVSPAAADGPPPWDRTVRALTDGRPLSPPPITFARRAELESNLRAAKAALDADPKGEDALIWYGRRLAYLHRYADAIDTFSRGIEFHPGSYRFLRHRGHRFITVRRFDLAIVDLSRAARLAEGTVDRIEPDGAPNAAGIPLTTDHSNIWYHLALAQYLTGDFESAARAWARCIDVRRDNDDSLVAATYWYYLTLRRLNRNAEAAAALAPIHAGMTILENTSYHAMLLMFKGERSRSAILRDASASELDAATVGYGLGIAALLDGDAATARSQFQSVTAASMWPAFGHIAAEAELARMPAVQAPATPSGQVVR